MGSKLLPILASLESGAWGDCEFEDRVPSLGSFHGCFYQVMISKRGMDKRLCTFFIRRFVPNGVNENASQIETRECDCWVSRFFPSLWFHYHLCSSTKWLRLWKRFGNIYWSWTFACISHDPTVSPVGIYNPLKCIHMFTKRKESVRKFVGVLFIVASS